MSEESGAEKTEKPTQHRRDKARQEGQVALSQEVGVALAACVLTMSVLWVLPMAAQSHMRHSATLLQPKLDGPLTLERAVEALCTWGSSAFIIAAPVGLLMMFLGTGMSVLQVGFHLNWENAGPKWNRLNPGNWFKKVFSAELPVNLLKSIFKGLGIVAVAGLGVYDLPTRLWRLSNLGAGGLAVEMRDIAFAVTARVAAALVLLAVFDVFWTRYRHEQKLMMSRQEIKDEMKDTEGNPHVKGAQRRRMSEFANRRLKDAVAEATVVTTNPTHFAVALRYWRGKDVAPLVVAKGADFKARRIKEYARELGIPVIEDKPLARALYSLVREGQVVPNDLYRSVARLLAIVYRRRGYLKRGRDS